MLWGRGNLLADSEGYTGFENTSMKKKEHHGQREYGKVRIIKNIYFTVNERIKCDTFYATTSQNLILLLWLMVSWNDKVDPLNSKAW